jgi:hypothetical protein
LCAIPYIREGLLEKQAWAETDAVAKYFDAKSDWLRKQKRKELRLK